MLPRAARSTKAEIARQENIVKQALPRIFEEVNEHAKWARTHPSTPRNPLGGEGNIHSNWTEEARDRYVAADESLGRKYFLVAFHSATFRGICELRTASRGPDELLTRLCDTLKHYKESLLMMALAGGLTPLQNYRNSPFHLWRPGDPSYDDLASISVKNPHEVYLGLDETFKRCKFKDMSNNWYDVNDIKENIYRVSNFRSFQRLAKGWPGKPGWPPKWEYVGGLPKSFPF